MVQGTTDRTFLEVNFEYREWWSEEDYDMYCWYRMAHLISYEIQVY